jgi:hypothetical protein
MKSFLLLFFCEENIIWKNSTNCEHVSIEAEDDKKSNAEIDDVAKLFIQNVAQNGFKL